MAPPEALLHRRVDVLGLVGEAVVVAVVRGPPEDPLLRGRLAEEGHDELPEAVHPVGAVGEVAVEARGDREHPEVVRPEAEGDPFPREVEGEDAQGGDVDEAEAEGGGRSGCGGGVSAFMRGCPLFGRSLPRSATGRPIVVRRILRRIVAPPARAGPGPPASGSAPSRRASRGPPRRAPPSGSPGGPGSGSGPGRRGGGARRGASSSGVQTIGTIGTCAAMARWNDALLERQERRAPVAVPFREDPDRDPLLPHARGRRRAIEAMALARSFRSRRMFPGARKNQPKTGIFATSFFPMTTARLG